MLDGKSSKHQELEVKCMRNVGRDIPMGKSSPWLVCATLPEGIDQSNSGFRVQDLLRIAVLRQHLLTEAQTLANARASGNPNRQPASGTEVLKIYAWLVKSRFGSEAPKSTPRLYSGN